MTAAQSVASALACLTRNDLDQAEDLCNQILRDAPKTAEAWHVAGVVAAQRGQFDQAIERFQEAIACAPAVARYDYNLGLAYKELGELEPAVECYRRAISKQEDFLEAHNNLSNALMALNRTEEAAICFRELLRRFPDASVGHYNLANLLQDTGHMEESVTHYQRVLELDPGFSSARENLGRALVDAGRIAEAQQVWKSWLDYEPDNAMAQHMLAAASGEDIPARCDDNYIREAFSQEFADSFDEQLKRLHYQAPSLVVAALQNGDLELAGLDILDAGCGTGLCGPLVRGFARHLVGVDLSAQMLDKARERHVYDETVAEEICSFMRSRVRKFDVIISADTLCYFGELGEVLAAAYQSLRQHGILVFTVESLAESRTAMFSLGHHGRYSHAEAYVRQALNETGFAEPVVTSATLRNERGRPVEGLVVMAPKSGGLTAP